MNMKLDQETVVKHQFWFLLGGYFLIWFIAVLCLMLIAPGEIAALKDGYEKAEKGVKDAKQKPINTTTFLPPWEKEAKEFSDHKGKIWRDAWNYQATMYDWPEEWLKKYDMTNPQTQILPDDRTEYANKLYLDQIDYWRGIMPKMLNPVEFKGGFDEVFKPMTKSDWKVTPTREEIWLAQEDFWVKRELLWDVLKAMTWQAQMLPIPIDEKKEPNPEGVVARYRCRNKNWEITLHIRKNDKGFFVIGGDSTIKNIHPSRHPQPLTSAKGSGILFNVMQDNVRNRFEVRGEPVGWSETKTFTADKENYPEPLGGINWDKEWVKKHPIYVSQGFDQTNSPIRRINAIEVGKQDCRTFIWPLQPNHVLAELDALPEDEAAKQQAAASSSAGGGMPGAPGGMSGSPPGGSGSMMPKMPGMPGMPGMGAGAKPGNPTPNNEIERDRYLQPKDQDKKLNPPSRHLPVALQLVVEQTHMHDVLIALANSRLRFQVTQVEFRHDPDYKPQSDADKKGGSDTTGPADRSFTGGMPGMYGRMGSGMMGMQRQQGQQMQQRDDMMRRQMQQQMDQQRQMGGMMPGAPGGMMPGPMGGSSISRPRGGLPMGSNPSTAGGSATDKSASTPQDDNLAELTIYGIATLYRSPDAPQTTEQPGQPGSTTPQTVPQTTTAAPPPQAPPQAGQQPAVKTPSPQADQQPLAPTPPAPAKTNNPPPKTDNAPPPQKQPDKPVDPKKAPPPAPPAGNKK
jgi:hypothetical protein